MQEFAVTWKIELDADSPDEAARRAWDLIRAADSTASLFTVVDGAGIVRLVDAIADQD